MTTIQTSAGPLTPSAAIDELTYRCYAFNRERNSAALFMPWFQIHGKAFEARWQAEQRKKAAK